MDIQEVQVLVSKYLIHYTYGANAQFETLPHFQDYWKEDHAFLYLLKQKEMPIGFALIHNHTLNEKANWKMAEFFILSVFRRQGIARFAMMEIMKKHPGTWEIPVYKDNVEAQIFWKNTLPNIKIHQYPQYPDFIVYETITNLI
jgi:predicted acetyltransferase